MAIAAEAANPTPFIGEALTVQLYGGANTLAPPITATASVTMSVRATKT